MNEATNETRTELWGDVCALMRYVLDTPVWESRSVSETQRLGRERARARRKARMKELSNNIRRNLQG